MVLKTLYEQHNITKASEVLFLSQPALSYRIQQLEKDFGVVILERGKKGIKFTPQGEYLYKYSLEMLDQMRSVKENLLSMDQKVLGILKIGSTRSLIKSFLPKYLGQFSGIYPTVEFNVKSGRSDELVDKLYNREIHVGFVRNGIEWDGEKKILLSEAISIISDRKITYSDLPSLHMISYNTEASLAKVIDTWWKSMYLHSPNIIMTVDNVEVAREMVRHHLGYAILPNVGLSNTDGLYLLPLKTEKGENIVRESLMIYQKKSLSVPLVKAFIEHITDNL
jgi:DNA-binding transcriptional LysR family regulator